MKTLILLFILLFSISAQCRVYLAGSLSSVKQIDSLEDDTINSDLLLNGTGYSAALGYRFSFLAFEAFYKSISTNSRASDQTFDLDDTMTGLGIRVYLASFLNFKIGTVKHDASGVVESAGANLLEYESTGNTTYTGGGIRIPFGMLDVFIDFTQYASEHDSIENLDLLIHDYEVGLRYHI
jgi:hypothetical protein